MSLRRMKSVRIHRSLWRYENVRCVCALCTAVRTLRGCGTLDVIVVQVIPGIVHPPSCYPTGEGYDLDVGPVTVPLEAVAEEHSLPTVLDFPCRAVPDRPEVTLVACDMWGNQVRSGAALVTPTLYRYLTRPPSRASSVSSGLDSLDHDESHITEDGKLCDTAADGDGDLGFADGVAVGTCPTTTSGSGVAVESTDESKLDLEPSHDGVGEQAGPAWYPVGRMANEKVTDNGDGTYTIAFTMHKSGRYKLDVRAVGRSPSMMVTFHSFAVFRIPGFTQVSVNGEMLPRFPIYYCGVDVSPPPKLAPLQYDSEDDRQAEREFREQQKLLSPAASTMSSPGKTKRLKDKQKEMGDFKSAAAKMRADVEAAEARAAARAQERMKAEEMRQFLHVKSHWARIAQVRGSTDSLSVCSVATGTVLTCMCVAAVLLRTAAGAACGP